MTILEKEERARRANILKAAFNQLWDRALQLCAEKNAQEALTYRDMTRMADAIRMQGPEILGLKTLPNQIDASLQFAISAVDPNKIRSKENMKKGLGALSGASGLTLASVCLANLLNPGLWAVVVAFFTGGIAAGPLAVVGIGAGLLMVAAGVYKAFQKMNPKERATKAHEFVMKGIDNWVKFGSDDALVSPKQIENSQVTDKIGDLLTDLNEKESIAASFLLIETGKADGSISAEEEKIILQAIGSLNTSKMPYIDAIETLNALDHDKKREIAAWCFSVAMADNTLELKESNFLKQVCMDLDVDYNSLNELFKIKK